MIGGDHPGRPTAYDEMLFLAQFLCLDPWREKVADRDESDPDRLVRRRAGGGFAVLHTGDPDCEVVDARFGLDPALEVRIRGEYPVGRQRGRAVLSALFRPLCAGGFFFEIVQQRQGNYLGYGAPHAPFRIAAQKRSARPAGLPRL